MKIRKLHLIIGVAVLAILSILMLVWQPKSGEVAGARTDIAADAQILTLTAKGGYFPNQLTAKANKSSILRITTKNTYDCSASFVMVKLNIDTTLPPTGTTDFQIPPQPAGTVLTGACTSGSDGFKITFL